MLQDHKSNKKTSNKIPIVNYYHENNSIKTIYKYNMRLL